jgi:hypothetical protein
MYERININKYYNGLNFTLLNDLGRLMLDSHLAAIQFQAITFKTYQTPIATYINHISLIQKKTQTQTSLLKLRAKEIII